MKRKYLTRSQIEKYMYSKSNKIKDSVGDSSMGLYGSIEFFKHVFNGNQTPIFITPMRRVTTKMLDEILINGIQT